MSHTIDHTCSKMLNVRFNWNIGRTHLSNCQKKGSITTVKTK